MTDHLLAKTRLLCGALAITSLAFLAGACGGDDDDVSEPATVPAGGTATGGAASPSAADGAAVQVTNGILTGSGGRTLYTFDNDTTPGQSSCSGGCAATWPPVTTNASAAAPTVSGASGTFTVITRADGSGQIAYNGKPLYLYAADSAAGQTNGDGVGGVWHTAKP